MRSITGVLRRPSLFDKNGRIWMGIRDAAILAAAIFVPAAVAAQECVDYSGYLRPLSWAVGGGYSVDVSGDYAYASSTRSLRILDLHDPSRPVWRGSAPITNWPRAVAVSGQVAYVVEEPYASLLHAVDVSDPDNPFVISTVPTSGWCQSVAVSGHHVYALCQGLKVVDVSDPASMVLTDVLYNLYDSNALDVRGDLVAVASSQFDQYGHLHLINVANPADVRLIKMMYLPGAAYAVALHGNFAYVGGRIYPPGLGRLFIVDISNLQVPVLAAQIALPAVPRAVTVRDDALYVIDDARQLTTYKISDPVHPELIGSTYLGGTGKKLAFAGNMGVTGAGGVKILEAVSPSSPAIIGQADGIANAKAVACAGSLAFLAGGSEGLFVVDVSRPAEPTVKGSIGRGSFDFVNASSEVILAADNDAASGGGKLVAIDVSTPDRPAVAGTVDVGSKVTGLSVAGSLAYVVSADDCLQTFEVGDRQAMRRLGRAELGHGGTGVCVDAALAFVASSTVGLRVVDVSDPAHPVGKGSVALADCTARAVAARGDHAFVVGSGIYDNMYVVDISDPDVPTIIASTKLQGDGLAAIIDGSVLYVAAQAGGLLLVDISEPTAPAVIGARSFASSASGVQVVGGRAYVAAGSSGLLVMPAQCPGAVGPAASVGPVVDGGFRMVHPNPFNPRTTIGFAVAERGRVTITVFDARGREVATILDEVLEAGEHDCEWNGTDRAGRRQPSGSFLCRLTESGSTWTAKLLLLR